MQFTDSHTLFPCFLPYVHAPNFLFQNNFIYLFRKVSPPLYCRVLYMYTLYSIHRKKVDKPKRAFWVNRNTGIPSPSYVNALTVCMQPTLPCIYIFTSGKTQSFFTTYCSLDLLVHIACPHAYQFIVRLVENTHTSIPPHRPCNVCSPHTPTIPQKPRPPLTLLNHPPGRRGLKP